MSDFLSPERRQAIQVFAGSVAPLAIMFGFGTDGIWEQVLIILGAALQLGSSLLSLINVRDVRTGWKVLRGAIYTAAMTVSPALVLLGLYSPEVNAVLLTAVSLGLAALSNLLAIFVGKDQEIAAAADRAGLTLYKGSDGTFRFMRPTPTDPGSLPDPFGKTNTSGPTPVGGDKPDPFGKTN